MQRDKYHNAMYDINMDVEVTPENEDTVRDAAKCWLATTGNAIFDDNGARVESVDMCGGKYLMFDANGEIAGLTDDIDTVFTHLCM